MKAKDTNKTERSRKAKTKEGNSRVRWLISVFFATIIISATFSFLSSTLLEGASLIGAFIILLVIISIGILFDLLGVAVTASDEKPFHSMAARKVPGASEAIALLRNAGKVSSICNDVIGDICGIISGTAAAVIAIQAFSSTQGLTQKLCNLGLSALVAGLTVGGKACGKSVALENGTAIVHFSGRIIFFFKKIFGVKN